MTEWRTSVFFPCLLPRAPARLGVYRPRGKHAHRPAPTRPFLAMRLPDLCSLLRGVKFPWNVRSLPISYGPRQLALANV